MVLRAAIVLAALSLVSAASARDATHPRLLVLYASDATGPMEIFAADPSGKSPVRQVTFGRPWEQCRSAAACGFSDPLPSPDGRRLAFWSGGFSLQARTLWLSSIDGSGQRRIASATAAEWSPDSKRLFYWAADGVHAVTRSGADRHLTKAPGGTPPPQSLWQGVLGWAWSSDGRTSAYATRVGIFLVPATGGVPRRLYTFSQADLSPFPPNPFELAFSPDGHTLAVTFTKALGLLDVRTHSLRTVPGSAHDLSWAPDGRLLYVQRGDSSDGDWISTGDVRTVTPGGHVRVIVSRSAQYGGQIVAAAWTTLPPGVTLKPPQRLDGVFAGGPVQKLAADGDQVAYASCGGVSIWNARSGTTTAVQPTGICYAPFSRSGHVGALALADDRVLWWSAYTGLGFRWSMYQATPGAAPLEVANGDGNLGATPREGSGTAVGAGSLLVMSSWTLHYGNGTNGVDQQTIERVDPAGCPCPTISTSAGPYTPLDVDQGRIVVSSQDETQILAADGTILLSVPVATLAAQLDGSQLVIAAGDELRVYDAQTGTLGATWPLPEGPVGHDCDLFTDPSCNYGRPSTPLALEDVSHGLATYVNNGHVHVLRLSDGADRVVGDGTLARFVNAGLAYADGARIRLTPYDELASR